MTGKPIYNSLAGSLDRAYQDGWAAGHRDTMAVLRAVLPTPDVDAVNDEMRRVTTAGTGPGAGAVARKLGQTGPVPDAAAAVHGVERPATG